MSVPKRADRPTTVVQLVLAAIVIAAVGASCTVHQTETPAASTSPSDLTVSPNNPIANFSFSPSSPVTNLSVNFDGSSSCPAASCSGSGRVITSYSWNFGDGVVAAGGGATVSHAFTTNGRFTVALTVTNDAGMAALTTRVLTVGTATPPTASFITSPASPQVGQSATFNANGSSAAQGRTIASYSWNFGDGGTATGATASHSYTTAGTYNVGLVVVDDVGQRATASNTVTVTPPIAPPATARPTAVFVFSPTAPLAGQTVSFNATQSVAAAGHTIANYEWNFGDGGTATGVTATHTFGTGGTYNVVLAVTDDLGQAGTATQAVNVASSPNTAAPTPVFVFSPSAPGVNEPVFFNASQSTAASGHSITSYSWNFGDGSPTGTGVTVSHQYVTAGTYSATLLVTDDTGKSATSSPQTITVGNPPAPTAKFTFSPTNPQTGQPVTFDTAGTTTAQGQSVAQFDWNFGDGTAIVTCHVPAQGGDAGACTGGANRTIAHTYTTQGTYTVNLTVIDTAGRKGSANATLSVGNPNPIASFTSTVFNAATHTMTFNGSGSTAFGGATIVTYSWAFGDGSAGSGQIVQHPYAAAGNYTVTLTVTDSLGHSGTFAANVVVP
jgi:PKD repeat protein